MRHRGSRWCWKTQSYLTLCDQVDCSLQGSSVHGISQARILEWIAISFSRGSSQHRDKWEQYSICLFLSDRFHLAQCPQSLPTFSRIKWFPSFSQLSNSSLCSHVWMWEIDHIESWVPKNWCFSTVMLEKTLESPLDCKEIKPISPKGNQSWIFIGRSDSEASIFWPPDAKNWLIGKDPNAGKDWGQEEKVTTEDEMVGWHHWLDVHEFASSGSWWWTGKLDVLQCIELDRTEWLNWTLCVCIYMPHHFKTYLFRLCWVFLAAWGLALVGASWCYSVSCCAWASPCSGFSLWSMGFRCTGFCSYSPQVLELGLNSCGTQT